VAANFYKCADKLQHPHWLNWSPVDFPKPNFHLPQSFGVLELNEVRKMCSTEDELPNQRVNPLLSFHQ